MFVNVYLVVSPSGGQACTPVSDAAAGAAPIRAAPATEIGTIETASEAFTTLLVKLIVSSPGTGASSPRASHQTRWQEEDNAHHGIVQGLCNALPSP
ncbi:hypothetical protein GCM10027610_064700 [Dactylosporangium cerinum]